MPKHPTISVSLDPEHIQLIIECQSKMSETHRMDISRSRVIRAAIVLYHEHLHNKKGGKKHGH